MKNNEEIFNLAKQLHLSGKIEESQKLYLQLTESYKNNDKLFFLLGTTFLQMKKYEDAIHYLNISIKLNPKFSDSYNNKGIALAETEKYLEALKNYNKAIKLKENYVDAYLNKGISLNKLKRYEEAINITELVIKLQPLNAKAYNNLGNILKNIKKYNDAVRAYDKAIKINPNYLEALNNLADTLHTFKKYDKALIYLNKIFNKKPEFDGLLTKIISNKMHIYDWENYDEIINLIKDKILKNKTILDPLFLNYLTDDPNLIKINSEAWVIKNLINPQKIEKINYENTLLKKLKKIKNENKKIKVGYFSAEFHHHVVLHIMTNIFKHHNLSKFEIYGFSHGKIKDDDLRKKIKPYFKKFFIINDMSDTKVVKLTRDMEIDMAINLTGLTNNERSGIFLKRVAPIQINYLGYPGTTAIKSMDYIIADKTIIPEKEKKYYTEKVKYMPECYISEPNDLLLKFTKNFSRSDFDLPENNIIFCAIHNPLKITPEIFDVWTRILKKVKGSVLWVNFIDEYSKKNLLAELKKKKSYT